MKYLVTYLSIGLVVSSVYFLDEAKKTGKFTLLGLIEFFALILWYPLSFIVLLAEKSDKIKLWERKK